MSPVKETQVEDSPAIEKEKAEAETQPTPKKKTIFQRALPWVIVAVVFFLVGAGLVFFTLYHSARVDLQAAKSETAQLNEKLSSTEIDLQKASTDLTQAQSSLAAANDSMKKAQMLAILYKFQADVNGTRASLLALDPSSARQTLTYASADLTELAKTGIDPQSLSGLQPRIDTAAQYLESDPQKALDALNTLYTNLAIVISNIK